MEATRPQTTKDDSNVAEAATTATAKCHDVVRSTQTRVDLTGDVFSVGRSPRCEIVLDSPMIVGEVAVFQRVDGVWTISVVGLADLELNGEPLDYGGRYKIDGVEANLFVKPGFHLEFRFHVAKKRTLQDKIFDLIDETTNFAETVHLEILERLRGELSPDSDARQIDDDSLMLVETRIEDVAREEGLLRDERREFADFLAGSSVYDQIVSQLTGGAVAFDDDGDDAKLYSRFLTSSISAEESLDATARKICARLCRAEKTEKSLDSLDSLAVVEKKFWPYWFSIVTTKVGVDFRNYLALRYLKKNIKDVLFGYGPLEDLLRTPSISEIMVVDYKTIFIQRGGKLENSGRRFFSDKITQSVVSRIVARANRRVDRSQPLVDARLSDGSRVNAVIDPIATSGTCLTIRRFPTNRLTVDKLIEYGSLTESAAEFLRASILARKNILVSGGTGTGKTSLLNCLCDYVPDDERIVVVEDVGELRIAKRHVVRLEAKPANLEGKGAYTIRDLVKNALRMRPDRVVVGECRGEETVDMLQAMNTGHDGSLTTLHANTSKDAVLRLETLVQLGMKNLPIESIDRQIVAAVDLIVQLKRLRNGRRCVSQISEVVEIDPETKEVILRDLFLLDGVADDAKLAPTGSLPTFMSTLLDKNLISLDRFYL